jgi:hypothetical protein
MLCVSGASLSIPAVCLPWQAGLIYIIFRSCFCPADKRAKVESRDIIKAAFPLMFLLLLSRFSLSLFRPSPPPQSRGHYAWEAMLLTECHCSWTACLQRAQWKRFHALTKAAHNRRHHLSLRPLFSFYILWQTQNVVAEERCSEELMWKSQHRCSHLFAERTQRERRCHLVSQCRILRQVVNERGGKFAILNPTL